MVDPSDPEYQRIKLEALEKAHEKLRREHDELRDKKRLLRNHPVLEQLNRHERRKLMARLRKEKR